MKSIRLNLPAWLRPVRLLLTACVCALLLFSQVSPAYSGTKSSPTGGEANLTEIEKEAQKAVLEDPYSREKTQAKANAGLNEIQGAADAQEMKRPSNTSPGAESVEQKVKEALEKVTGKDKD
jgi:hypothetical protein